MLPELEIVEALCRGVDPRTGEMLNTPRDPRIDQIRLRFLNALRRHGRRNGGDQERKSPQNAEYPNRGKAWSPEDDRDLEERWNAGSTLDQMVPMFGRTAGALAARLVYLAIFPDRDEARKANVARGGQYGSAAGFK